MTDLQSKHCHTPTVCHHAVPVPPVKPQVIVPFKKAQEDFIEAFHVIDFGLIALAAAVVVMGFKLHKLSMPKISVSGIEAAAKSDAAIAFNWLKSLVISKWTLLLIIGGSLIALSWFLSHPILAIGLGLIAAVVAIKFGLTPATVISTVKTDATAVVSAIHQAEASVKSLETSITGASATSSASAAAIAAELSAVKA
jgi:hypothetical protein